MALEGAGEGAFVSKLPVAGGGKGGNSSTTAALPCTGPMAAVRRLTDCNTSPSSTLAPTWNARGRLPSTAIKAIPWVAGARGAMTPANRKRELIWGDVAAADSVTGGTPSKRDKSPLATTASPAETAYAGAVGPRTSKRSPQNVKLAATKDHMKKADSRACMRRL